MYTATLSSSGCFYHRDGVAITKEEFEAALMSMTKAKAFEARNSGVKNRAAKLTEEQAFQIKNSTDPVKTVARKFGVSIFTVSAIRNGKRWKYL